MRTPHRILCLLFLAGLAGCSEKGGQPTASPAILRDTAMQPTQSDSPSGRKISAAGYDITPLPKAKVAELASHLSAESYRVTQNAGTEPAFCGNLLDNTMVFFSSDCSEGWSHSVQKQPIIIAGRGGGYLKTPTAHYASNGGNPTDVLLTMLRRFNPAAASVGGGAPMSTTPFTDILA